MSLDARLLYLIEALRRAPMPHRESVYAQADWDEAYDTWWHAHASEAALAALMGPAPEAPDQSVLARIDRWIADDNLNQNILALHHELEEATAELARLKRGDFTPEEIQTFCHNLPDTVSREAFAQGCVAYQQKLYGPARCPHGMDTATYGPCGFCELGIP